MSRVAHTSNPVSNKNDHITLTEIVLSELKESFTSLASKVFPGVELQVTTLTFIQVFTQQARDELQVTLNTSSLKGH